MDTLEADVIVISAGTAGLAAAVAAAEKGMEVIAFEKGSTTGGTANMGMGPFAVESRLQKLKNVPLTREEAFNIFMEATHWSVDARLVSNYINKSADTIAWLEEMGVEFIDCIAYIKGAHFTHHVVKPASGVPGPRCASYMMKALTERAEELGVQIFLQTPVKKIIKEEGRITGVIAEGPTGEIRANAKAVIIATGGFGDNPEWIKEYTGFEWGRDLYSTRVPGLVGDGIKMAWEVGAGRERMQMELICNIPVSIDDQGNITPDMIITNVFKHPNLMVNIQGERFINEEIMGNPSYLANAVARQKDRCAFVIVDAQIVKHYEKRGFEWLTVLSPEEKVDNLYEVLEQECENSEHMFAADSLEELAEKTGINLAGLKRTLDEYNEACETGRDKVFYKSPRYLRPIRKPKFFAGKYYPSAYGSLGGIKVNHRLEVLTEDYEIIPGLYAAGVDANAIYGDTYVFILPGNTMGFALNSGRMAGENAADYVASLDQ